MTDATRRHGMCSRASHQYNQEPTLQCRDAATDARSLLEDRRDKSSLAALLYTLRASSIACPIRRCSQRSAEPRSRRLRIYISLRSQHSRELPSVSRPAKCTTLAPCLHRKRFVYIRL